MVSEIALFSQRFYIKTAHERCGTTSLPRKIRLRRITRLRKNTWLSPVFLRGRGGGNRTRVAGFGDQRPTIERRPYVSCAPRRLRTTRLADGNKGMHSEQEIDLKQVQTQILAALFFTGQETLRDRKRGTPAKRAP
jgi:hypothetical protein